ncbi:MAG TPA: DUF3187 family protein [Planctomycetota bacterium]|nr:DUF3187 family protein [Planctomycetota bacterium]
MRAPPSLTAALAACLATSCAIFQHEDHPAPIVRGPIPARTQQVVKLTYLDFRPRRAAIQPADTTGVSVQAAYSSVYQNGHSGTDDVVFDGEILRTSIAVRRAVSPSADLEIELAVLYATNGFLDLFVENYHSFFGLPSEGRDSRPRNDYEMDAFHDGVEAYRLEAYEPGLADLPIIFTHAIVDETENRPAISWRAGVELPTGSESKGFGNGAFDWGGGVLGEKSLGRWSMTGAVDYAFIGTSHSFERANIEAQDNLDLQLGAEYRWNDRMSLLLGTILESAATRGIPIKEMDGAILSIDVGAAWDLGDRSRFLLEFGEDAIAKSGPDFTVMAAWSCSL